MNSRRKVFFEFVRHFARDVLMVREVLASLFLLIVIGGLTISYVEKIAVGESVYFAFITGLSIGYGDITPKTAIGHLMSIGIGMIGMLFTGITVAIATRTLSKLVSDRSQNEL